MTKQEIRASIREVLADTKSSFKSSSKKICTRILKSGEYKTSNTILAYMALPDEPDLSTVIEQALQDGKNVYIPRIIPGTSDMDFFLYEKSQIQPGSFFINEPSEQLPKLNEHTIKGNTLILVPGRAFTKEGNRLGRGKAFYDNYLFKMKKAAEKSTAFKLTLAGVCFSCQVLDSLPVEDHDIKMNLIFAE